MNKGPRVLRTLLRLYFSALLLSPIQEALSQTAAGALHFDGVNDDVTITNPFYAFGKELTVEWWVNINSAAIGSGIGQSVNNVDNNTNSNVWLMHSEANGTFNFYVNDAGTWRTTAAPMSITPGWHHVAGTASATSVRVYLDGNLISTGPGISNTIFNAPGSIIALGRDVRYTSGRFMSGAIDEVRIWNRALCQAEIQNNRNAELLPANQTGLKGYYKFNQGNVGATNSGITTLTDASGNGYNGTLNNFALTGSTSNWVAGAVSGTASAFTPASLAGTVGGAQTCASYTIPTGGLSFPDASCNLVARVLPSGASPVSGTVNSCVRIGASVPSYNGQPFVQRYYDLTPAANASTATATITLYYLQSEFTAYNAARGGRPALPTSPADASGIANLRVTQYHGTGTAPGNYSGSAELINPADANIVWDATNARWAVTFPVTGFSGFYLHTTSFNAALPVRLTHFSGRTTAAGNELQWSTQETGTSHFIVQRSTDGRRFIDLARVNALGNGNGSYAFTDAAAATGYYRLHIIDSSGAGTYSLILKLGTRGGAGLVIYPNPARKQTLVSVDDVRLVGSEVLILNALGNVVRRFRLQARSQQADLEGLPAGIYSLRVGGMTQRLLVQ